MATTSTGITVTFDGLTFSQVTGLSWDFATGMPVSRSVGPGSAYTPEAGQVTIESLGGAATYKYGTRGTVSIQGGGMNLTYTGVLLGTTATASINGVTKYKHVIKLIA